MKTQTLNKLTALAAVLASVNTASAATTFAGGDYGNAANWNNGLPTSVGNPGTVAVNGTVTQGVTYTNYYVTQTAGTISVSGVGNPVRFDGGTFTQNGGILGSTSTTSRGFTFQNNNVTTLDLGRIISGDKDTTNITTGASLVINGGSYEQYGTNRGVNLTTGGSLTVNGGTLTTVTASATGIFGFGSTSTGTSTINLNGGTTSVNFLGFGRNVSSGQLTLNLGGTTAGSFTAVDFVALSVNELITERAISWFSGSLMTMTITNEADWAEIEWNAGRMLYDGQGFGVLGNWATVNGDIFDWDGSTNTLSLIPIPEPASASLIGIAFGAFAFVRRRPRA